MTASPTSMLSTQDELLWRRFTAVLATVPAALDERLRDVTGLNHHQFSILAMLASRPDRTLQMANVAKATDSSLSRLSHTVTKLEAAGLVTRRTCDHDRRASWAVLTDQGLAVVADASDKYDALKREVLVDRVPEQVRPQLTALLTALLPDAVAEQCTEFDADLTR
ncbi:MarR family winged helix-turn-helix transcriptional regulator [Demequina sp. B12]|uniref:MarR family winged helix-turn-helix transcriptional regulator n=1 Tax=Demequina sp. B12 TaxID=2992757 RepID=UPI00237A49B9|nr:MarR family winged helix-turn-helix transcriptional regulator [Demequina sp. B12]MDE0573613.1 MarR family winged helix-turn-helix transcriptional regulator [Demequina sp. B12]